MSTESCGHPPPSLPPLPPCPLSSSFFSFTYHFSNVLPLAAVSALPGNSFKMQILKPHRRPTDSETPGRWSPALWFHRPSRWFCRRLKFENHCPKGTLVEKDHLSALLLGETVRGELWAEQGRPRPICPHQSVCGYFTKLTFIPKLILNVKIDTLWISTDKYINILKNNAAQQAW